MIEPLWGDLKPMLSRILKKLTTMNIASPLLCDHICYRVETEERYNCLKKKILVFSRLCAETEVNGRMIAIFELNAAPTPPMTFKTCSNQ